jgi:hypothetical protein
MPTPNRNAPTITETLKGTTNALSVRPNTGWGRDSRMTKAIEAITSMAICARRPADRRSLITTLHAVVKPNEA